MNINLQFADCDILNIQTLSNINHFLSGAIIYVLKFKARIPAKTIVGGKVLYKINGI